MAGEGMEGSARLIHAPGAIHAARDELRFVGEGEGGGPVGLFFEEALFGEVGGVPEFERFVRRGRGEQFAIGREREIEQAAFVREAAGKDLVRAFFGAGADGPDTDAVITTSTEKCFAIDAEDNARLLLRSRGPSGRRRTGAPPLQPRHPSND